jgi:intracellular septation protein
MTDAIQKPPVADQHPPLDSKQLMKMLVELGPLVVFFAVNATTKNIFYGTGTFMVATVVALIVSQAWFGRVPMMPLVSGIFVLVFGGLTLWLQDAVFIKLKPTIVNTLFALLLLGGLAFGQLFLRYILGEVFKLSDKGWRLLTIRWSLFFLLLAVLNEIVWRNFSEDFWIGFKMLGVMPLTAAFGFAQLGLLRRHAVVVDPNGGDTSPVDSATD